MDLSLQSFSFKKNCTVGGKEVKKLKLSTLFYIDQLERKSFSISLQYFVEINESWWFITNSMLEKEITVILCKAHKWPS